MLRSALMRRFYFVVMTLLSGCDPDPMPGPGEPCTPAFECQEDLHCLADGGLCAEGCADCDTHCYQQLVGPAVCAEVCGAVFGGCPTGMECRPSDGFGGATVDGLYVEGAGLCAWPSPASTP